MKTLCLISPAFAFPVGERGLYFPHGELAKALQQKGIQTTIICLGPNIDRTEGDIEVHAVPMAPSNAPMLASWMPSNSYYLSAASALWQKYLELTAHKQFDLLDVPAYLPFDAAAVGSKTALVVRAYSHELDGVKQNAGAYPVDRIMLENMQALALLQADAILVDEQADAETNRWSKKLRHTFTARLMSELEASVFADEKSILPRNDLSTIMIGTSAADAAWGITGLKAIDQYLKQNNNVRFIMPVFQRELSAEELSLIEALKSRLSAENKLDRFYLIKPLAVNKLNGCIKAVDAVIAPIRDSGLPCIGMEALAAGKPIIVQRSNPLARFVDINKCGFVVDAEESQLISAFTHTLEAPTMGESGRSAAAQLFSDYVNTSLKCYVSALDSHASISGETASAAEAAPTPANTHQQFLAACDRLLYDIHYKTSLRFRVKHWINRLSQTRRHLNK